MRIGFRGCYMSRRVATRILMTGRTVSRRERKYTFYNREMFGGKKKGKAKKGRRGRERIAARIFCACTSRGRPLFERAVSQTDLNVSRDFASDFNYPSRVPGRQIARRRYGRAAPRRAAPCGFFRTLAEENAMNAPVDNEISHDSFIDAQTPAAAS